MARNRNKSQPGRVTYSLRTADLPGGEARVVPLPLDGGAAKCRIRLRCLPGAAGIQLPFVNARGEVVYRAEIKAVSGETLTVHIQTEGTDLRVSSPGKAVLSLPPAALYDPPPLIPPVAPNAPLDLALVIDGTSRSFARQEAQEGQEGQEGQKGRLVSEPLLDRKEVWKEHVERLSRFAEALAAGVEESRFTVLAFGDEELPGTETVDFRFRYFLHPPKEQRRFLPLQGLRVQEALGALLSTSGIDFVDALADALQACHGLPWAERSRKVVLVCGDSPGHSVLHPLPPGADRRPRQLDVDVEAEKLHRAGIEIATLYFDPPADPELRQARFQRELLDGARAQYARLAALSSWAFEASRFDPDQAAQAIRERPEALGRGAVLGELVEIL
jgi:hypothetical protein